jgi:hypothetical protein
MRVHAKKFQFAGIFDTGPTVHVRQSDMWMQQAKNGNFETGQFGSCFGLLKLIKMLCTSDEGIVKLMLLHIRGDIDVEATLVSNIIPAAPSKGMQVVQNQPPAA